MSGQADGQSAGMSNLRQRVLSSVVLVVAVIALTFIGGLLFRLLAAAIAAAVFYEWCVMSRTTARRHQLVAAVLLAAVLVALIAGYSALAVIALLAASFLATALDGRLGGQGFWTASGVVYAGLPAISLGFLRDGDHAGLIAILFLFAIVWATDICAYFVGRSLGGPRLAPRISPGKTQSGAVGGILGGVIAGLAVAISAGMSDLPALALIALLLSIVSQAGDLFESWVKRRHGVKDSGSLIPGHGGVMDRVDGLVAAAFALYVIGWLLGSADNPAQGLFAN